MNRLPRRALLGATLGALYAFLILPDPQGILGIYLPALGWFALSAGLLLLQIWSYHAFSLWAMLWVVYRIIVHVREGQFLVALVDLPLPLVSLFLVMSSGYREAALLARGGDEAVPE